MSIFYAPKMVSMFVTGKERLMCRSLILGLHMDTGHGNRFWWWVSPRNPHSPRGLHRNQAGNVSCDHNLWWATTQRDKGIGIGKDRASVRHLSGTQVRRQLGHPAAGSQVMWNSISSQIRLHHQGVLRKGILPRGDVLQQDTRLHTTAARARYRGWAHTECGKVASVTCRRSVFS